MKIEYMDGGLFHCSGVEERLSEMRTESCALYCSRSSRLELVFYKAAAD